MDREEMLKRLKKGEDPLELSIEKWQDIVDGKGGDDGPKNCALCEVYVWCHGCPVSEKTGSSSCDDTPYNQYSHASHGTPKEHLKTLAKKEVKFLKSLKSLRKEK